jgi:hypothetical protein
MTEVALEFLIEDVDGTPMGAVVESRFEHQVVLLHCPLCWPPPFQESGGSASDQAQPQ